MSCLYAILTLVTLQRLAELAYSRRNTKRLLSHGAREVGASEYPLFVVLHGAWVLTIAFTTSGDARPNLALLAVFALVQGLRIWIVASLGPYWTTRVITLPDAPLVNTGPYRYLRHPNYAVVVVEIALLPLAFGNVIATIVFSIVNAALLARRIGIEERTLAPRRSGRQLPGSHVGREQR